MKFPYLYKLKSLLKRDGGKRISPKDFKKKRKPGRDWILLLMLMFIMMTSIIFSSYFIYNNYVIESARNTSTDSKTIKTIDKDRLKETIESYDSRNLLYKKIIENRLNIVDPSF